MAYVPIEWKDEIIDPLEIDPQTGKPLIVQEGTSLDEINLNHMQQGIIDAHTDIEKMKIELARLAVYSEIDGRATGHNGTFFDTLDGVEPHLMKFEEASAMLPAPISASVSPIEVPVTIVKAGFAVGQEVTVFDDEHWERAIITAVTADKITLSALVNSYKKGAVLARSTVVIDPVAKTMGIGGYTTYELTFTEM